MELVALHVGILLVTFVAVFLADKEGFAYMRGTKEVLDTKRIVLLHRVVFLGLFGMIVTGAIMVWPYWSFYFADTVFRAKMIFVGVLVINSFFISVLLHRATKVSFKNLSKRARMELLISGGASTLGWLGALFMGMLLG